MNHNHYSPRVRANLEKWAQYIEQPKTAKFHRFIARPTDDETKAPAIISGDVLVDFIVADLHTIEYLGHVGDYVPVDVTPTTKIKREYQRKLKAFMQEEQIALLKGKQQRAERHGLYYDDTQLKEVLEAAGAPSGQE